MSASFSWRHEPIPQALQQQRGSQLVPPDAPESHDRPQKDVSRDRDAETAAPAVSRKPS
jgi:hypothetical protein